MHVLKSAALILVNSITNCVESNFKLLMLKRLSTSQSFADKVVFPGGVLDKVDYSNKWNPIIEKNCKMKHLNSLISKVEMPVYTNSKSLSDMPPQIFYRICAIRETFEETGILLAVDSNNKSVVSNEAFGNDLKTQNWQENVSKNPELFIELFKSFNLSPNLFSLHEWAEWLTPTFIKRRFHTAFFMSFIHDKLRTNINLDESKLLILETPEKIYESFKSNELAYPQLVDMLELKKFSSWRDVELEAVKRQNSGGIINNPMSNLHLGAPTN